MIAAWMLYAIVVGGLLGAAALALEGVLRTHGLPSRWIWVVSILVSVAWPLGHWSWENRPRPVTPAPVVDPPAATPADLPASVFPLEPVTVAVAPESVLRLLDGPILAAWAVATCALLLFFLFLFLRTWRLRSAWREEEVGDEVVLLSEEWGPAVVGFLRPRVVLPRWCEDLDDGTVRFILPGDSHGGRRKGRRVGGRGVPSPADRHRPGAADRSLGRGVRGELRDTPRGSATPLPGLLDGGPDRAEALAFGGTCRAGARRAL